MTYQGRGTTIELEKSQSAGSVAAIRQAMQAPPHLKAEDVDELERAIEAGRIPIQPEGIFDSRNGDN